MLWLNKFYFDFQKFIFTNNVLVAAAGWCVGVATKEVIETVIAVIILPLVVWLQSLPGARHLMQVTALTTVVKVAWTLLVWVLTIIMSFVLLEYFLNRSVFGMSSTINTGQEQDFVKAKAKAKVDGILSNTPQQILEVEQEAATDHRIVQKALQQGTRKLDQIIQEVQARDAQPQFADASAGPVIFTAHGADSFAPW
jgi:large-conductance mechanosensitive channel